jgi:hypothetical protein
VCQAKFKTLQPQREHRFQQPVVGAVIDKSGDKGTSSLVEPSFVSAKADVILMSAAR